MNLVNIWTGLGTIWSYEHLRKKAKEQKLFVVKVYFLDFISKEHNSVSALFAQWYRTLIHKFAGRENVTLDSSNTHD